MAESSRGVRWRRWLVRGLLIGVIAAGFATWMEPWAKPGITDQVMLRAGVDDRHSPLMTGETVPIEQYASIMLGPTTTLAKQAFVQTAHGQNVEWTMRLEDLSKASSGEISGSFTVRVVFKRAEGHESDQGLRFRCAFGETPGEHLMSLRKGDLATISGKLKLEERNWKDSSSRHPVLIERAKVIGVQPSAY